MPKIKEVVQETVLPEYLTRAQVLEHFGFTPWMLWRLMKHPDVPLPSVPFGRLKKFEKRALAQWSEEWKRYTEAGGTLNGTKQTTRSKK